MKCIYRLLAALAVLGAVFGCNKDKIEEQGKIEPAKAFKVNPDHLYIGGDGGSRTVSFLTNIPSWTVTITDSWIGVDDYDGTATQGTLRFNIQSNPSDQDRKGIVTVGGDGKFEKITITQSASGQQSQGLPTEPESGHRIYVLDETGWADLHLYIYGDSDDRGNNLIGTWPGRKVDGSIDIGPYKYKYVDIAAEEIVDDVTVVLEFNDNGGAHHSNRDQRPRLTPSQSKTSWFIVYADREVAIVDPLDPGIDPPTPGPIDDDSTTTDWAAANGFVYDDDALPEVYIYATAEEWNKLLAAYDSNPKTKDYVKVRVEYKKGSDVTEVNDVGLRLKGNTSRRRPENSFGENREHITDGHNWNLFHFYLNYHKFVKDEAHTIHGVRNTAFKFSREDPSHIREHYCYDLFRRFGVWTALYSSFARVWIKVGDDSKYTYLGVYTQIEHVDKNWMKARHDKVESNGGNLWKCRYQSHPADLKSTEGSFGPDDNVNTYCYELKTNTSKYNEAKAQIDNFITNLNSLNGDAFDKWIASVMDVDLLLKTYAVNVAVGMWDDYWNNYNNYYLYFNSTDKEKYQVFFIPYDYDNTLGTSANCGVQNDSGRQNPYHWGYDDNPLLGKIMKNSTWKAQYKKYLQELCKDGGLFNYSSSKQRIQSWQSFISPYVENDTGQDGVIYDSPASWGNHSEYRILSDDPNTNFFLVKQSVVMGMQ